MVNDKGGIESKVVPYLLGSIFVLLIATFFFSETCFYSGDCMQHYLIARYSWLHPNLFLDSWGKPFFTLICSLFAQFGLKGAIFFNVFCGVATAYFIFKICKILNLENAWIAIFFVLFAPGYFPTLNSGLTEPFFSFILMACIYGFFNKKYAISCIVISFLPFIRTEGFFILPLFILALVYRGQWFSILLLGFGTLLYSIIGKIFLNDFFWIMNQNPYNGSNKEIYGHGKLLHFVSNYDYLIGTTLMIFLMAGLLALTRSLQSNKTKNIILRDTFFIEELFLLYGSFAIYLVAHSIMWWKGWANSLGLLRVMAAVLPCTAIICLRGFNLLFIQQLRKTTTIKHTIIIGVLAFIIITPLTKNYFPFKLTPEQLMVKKAADWFKTTNYTKQRLIYLDPFLTYLLDVDTYDPYKVAQLWGLYPTIKTYGIDAIPDSSVVFWDAHYGANECRIPLGKLIEDNHFKLIKSFTPEIKFNTLSGSGYEIHVFMKLKKVSEIDQLKSLRFDFETQATQITSGVLDSTFAFSGNKSLKIISTNEYSGSLNLPVGDIPIGTLQCKMRARIYNPNQDSIKLVSVISFNDKNNNNLMYDGKNIAIESSTKSNDWFEVESTCNLIPSSYANKTNKFGFYFWNLNHKTYYIDNLELHFIGR
jgi:hypothetical protein